MPGRWAARTGLTESAARRTAPKGERINETGTRGRSQPGTAWGEPRARRGDRGGAAREHECGPRGGDHAGVSGEEAEGVGEPAEVRGNGERESPAGEASGPGEVPHEVQ